MPQLGRVFVRVQPGYNQTFRDRNGPVGRDLSRRATRVQLGAKAQVGVATGLLKQDITKNWVSDPAGALTISIGASRSYALVHHEGSRPHVIRPKSARALRFQSGGKVVFARAVHHHGTRPNRYLADNLRLAGD